MTRVLGSITWGASWDTVVASVLWWRARRPDACGARHLAQCRIRGGGLGRTVPIVELPVRRPSDVNRHRYAPSDDLFEFVRSVSLDVIDIREEPFSVAARRWLAAAGDHPVVMYTTQN